MGPGTDERDDVGAAPEPEDDGLDADIDATARRIKGATFLLVAAGAGASADSGLMVLVARLVSLV